MAILTCENAMSATSDTSTGSATGEKGPQSAAGATGAMEDGGGMAGAKGRSSSGAGDPARTLELLCRRAA
ncbi:hypothetical protein [Streptomyces sp. NPDC039028]|uniref:hypothetical protein n=1 Tax=Streptomyces sp. NPDC039028 TaxID=3155370 RepID=UPI0033ECC837